MSLKIPPKSLFALFVINLFFAPLKSQNLGRTVSDTIPDKYFYSTDVLRQHIYDKIPSYSKKGKYEKTTFKFADYASHVVAWDIKDGDIYYDWPELESYINDILKKILPPELKQDTMIHAYIHKSGRSNAHMAPTGHFFVSLGLIAEAKTEAQLAAVFAHEVAHYELQHSLKHFIKGEFGGFTTGLVRKNWFYNPYVKGQELEADSLGMYWLNQSGYHFLGHYNMMKALREIESRHLDRTEDQWEINDIPHATSSERFDLIRRFQKKNTIQNGAFYLVSEEKFNQFKEECKIESLRILLSNFDFHTCIEQAFRYHLFEPDNPTYVYYIMESIRLIGANFDKDIWSKNFISHRYYDTTRVHEMRTKKPVNRSIFESLEYKLVPINKFELKDVKAMFYWQGEKKFINNAQAMEFYYRVGEQIGCKECKMTYALSLDNKDATVTVLKQYLEQEDIAYRKYAETFVNGKRENNCTGQKLLVINDLEFYVKQGQEVVPLKKRNSDSLDVEAILLDTLKRLFPKRQIMLSSELRKYHLNDYFNLTQLRVKTSNFVIDKNQLYLYDKYKVDEIEFLDGEFYESRNLNDRIEDYKEIINTSYIDMLLKTRSSRYFDTWFRSVKLQSYNELSYDIHKGVDDDFKFKEPGIDRFFKKVEAVIHAKDKNPK